MGRRRVAGRPDGADRLFAGNGARALLTAAVRPDRFRRRHTPQRTVPEGYTRRPMFDLVCVHGLQCGRVASGLHSGGIPGYYEVANREMSRSSLDTGGPLEAVSRPFVPFRSVYHRSWTAKTAGRRPPRSHGGSTPSRGPPGRPVRRLTGGRRSPRRCAPTVRPDGAPGGRRESGSEGRTPPRDVATRERGRRFRRHPGRRGPTGRSRERRRGRLPRLAVVGRTASVAPPRPWGFGGEARSPGYRRTRRRRSGSGRGAGTRRSGLRWRIRRRLRSNWARAPRPPRAAAGGNL